MVNKLDEIERRSSILSIEILGKLCSPNDIVSVQKDIDIISESDKSNLNS